MHGSNLNSNIQGGHTRFVIDMDPEVYHTEITIDPAFNSIEILIQRAVLNCILFLGSSDSFHQHTTKAGFILTPCSTTQKIFTVLS